MASLTLKQCLINDIFIECRWNSYCPTWEVIVGKLYNDIVISSKSNSYGTKEKAIRGYYNQVAKAKKGE